MTDATSRDPSPLGLAADSPSTGSALNNTSVASPAGSGSGSASASASGSAGAGVAPTAQSANYTEPYPNNVTSAASRWANDRLPVQAPQTSSSRVVRVPRAPGISTAAFNSGSRSLSTSRSPSTATSPHSSRDSSPAGRVFRQQSVPAASSQQQSGMRSRKDSHDASPHRPPSITSYTSSVPSAAAIQRALSAATAPQMQPAPTPEPTARAPRSTKGAANPGTPGEGNTSSWPVSPRLKSPPPSASRRNSFRTQKVSDAVPPNIFVQNPTPVSSTDTLPTIDAEITQESDPKSTAPPAKSANRGASGAPTLETVQETSGPNTPGNELDAVSTTDTNQKYFDMPEDDRKVPSGSSTPRRSMAAAASKIQTNNSDSDNAKKSDGKKEQDNDTDKTPRPKAPSARASFSSLRQKTGAEPATRSMTVETETVNSVAQSALGAPSERASSRAERGGTLRAKASSDTIKPSKGRKKTSRKAPSINAAGGSTRADIFEDRVKNEMDEATSDSSDETFVYESNPADAPIRRSRHHSRTPSGASLTSVGGQRDTRSNQGLLGTQKTRSMKFANAYNSADDDAMDRTDGTVRAGNGRGGGSIVNHHHTGRPSRSTTAHASILDDDSPFPPLNKVRSLTGLPGRQTHNARIAARNLQATTNGNTNGNGNGIGSARKDNSFMSYDLDAEGGDDERTPLIGNTATVRTLRSVRRPPTRGSRTERYPRRRQGVLTRFAGCIAIIAMLFLLVFGIVGFLFIITTPLTKCQLYEIQSVLASETVLMFDLKIGAVNPNLVPITVSDVDIEVFAKSKYVGTEKWWREHPGGDWADEPLPAKKPSAADDGKRSSAPLDAQENFLPSIPDDFPDDSGDEPDTRKTMLLGVMDHFDNPVTFEPSFLERRVHNSTGAMRLRHPGEGTELGGSERWERVLLHDFDLIIRGTLKYTIPLGGKSYAANIGNRITVDPQKDDGPGPGEGKGPDAGDGGKGGGSVGSSHSARRWKFTVHPLEEELSTHERLKRRVWARLLRTL